MTYGCMSCTQVCPASGPIRSAILSSNAKLEFFDVKFNWDTANQCCTERGGELLSISSTEENSLANSLQSGSADFAGWIGLRYDQGAFKWVDGTAVSYAKWGSKQPKQSEDGYAVVIKRDNGKWLTTPEDRKKTFLCSIPL